ncbi:MAG TPA: hypothetical protein VFM70_00280 [Salinimicrobium sp.]|nr:hypothetical protein [Salinimicrobium sp.]
MKKITLIILIVSLTSCRTMVKMIANIEDPKVEKKEDIVSYMEDYEVNSNYTYALKDAQEFVDVLGEIQKLPNFLFYNSEGTLLNPENKNKCISDVGNFIKTLDSLDMKNPVEKNKFNMEYVTSRMVDLDGNPVELEENKYYMIGFWAKFMGKNCIKKVKSYVDEAEKRDDITIVLVSFDPQEYWEQEYEFELN